MLIGYIVYKTMKILTSSQIQATDHFTIKNEPISSIDLMERAATKCFQWIKTRYPIKKPFYVICGTGNNGGDGLALARLLYQEGYSISCFEVCLSKNSTDYENNKKRLPISITSIKTQKDFPKWDKKFPPIIIDALLGTGLSKPTTGILLKLIQEINQNDLDVISIDIPSGIFSEFNDQNSLEGSIKATYTLTFQFPKLAFLLPEFGNQIGSFYILDIKLHKKFIEQLPTPYFFTEPKDIIALIKPPKKFDHKGSFGHLLLVAGSEGKMGAAILAAKGALHSGIGKLSIVSPRCGLNLLQSNVVEAMVEVNSGQKALEGYYQLAYTNIAIGPGIGTATQTALFLMSILMQTKHPMILDADALNILAENLEFWKLLPKNSILTPHPKEFERLVGTWKSEKEKLEKLIALCKTHHCICILKGAYTAIGLPDEKIFFNSSGNPGMATAGSGDVLTGILGSLLAQGYSPENTARIGVYLHGLAGDIAMKKWGYQAMTASNIQQMISKAFNEILS